MLSKILLWFLAIAYFVYGVMSLYDPLIPANYAGLSFTSNDAAIEVGAMYGGLSLGLGLFFVVGALRTQFTQAALLLGVLGLGGLGLSRALLFALSDSSPTSYTFGAMGFEIVVAILALIAYCSHAQTRQ